MSELDKGLAEYLIEGIIESFPRIKAAVEQRDYESASLQVDWMYTSRKFESAKPFLYHHNCGPSLGMEFFLLRQALQERNEEKINTHVGGLETFVRQINLRKEVTTDKTTE